MSIRLGPIALALLLLFAMAIPATAGGIQTWRFSITGEDLMDVVYADGTTGETATEVGIHDGGRLYRHANGYVRSFIGDTTANDENSAFRTWFDSTETRLGSFNLWGQDGRGAHWGEVYNSADQESISDADGWSSWKTSYTDLWGNGPDSTDSFIGWDADSFADSIGFGDGSETNWDAGFTFDVTLNSDDWNWYDENGTPWYDDVEGQMVFWFGGYELAENGDWGRIYEGNIVLTGHMVPLPAAAGPALGLLAGFLTLRTIRRRRNRLV